MALAIARAADDPLSEQPLAPMWWLRRLHTNLLERRNGLNLVKRYYKGNFEWKYADRKLRQVFGYVFYESRLGVNWMKLITSSVAQRLQVDGIRLGDQAEQDPVAWDLWQTGQLDARSPKVHHLALLYGESYVTVWPGDDKKHPDFKIDHPAVACVELNPDNELERLAGLRTYVDVQGYLHAQLFLPDATYLYASPTPIAGSKTTRNEIASMTWVMDESVVPNGVMDNPWGTVPMVPFRNIPAADWPGEEDGRFLIERSELYGVMPIQDAINSVLINTLLVANAQGYRQRWATGLEIERDEQGRPKEPFRGGVDRLWQAESDQTKFGDFAQSDVSGLMNLIEMLVGQLAAASQVPPHYLEAKASRLSADSIRAAESGLISKVMDKHRVFGLSWEEVMRMAGMMTDNASLAEARSAEVMWMNPETHTMAALYDAALKSVAIGIPWRGRMEMLGYTPQAIALMQTQREEDAKLVQPAIDALAQVKVANPGDPTSLAPGPTLPPSPSSLPRVPTTGEPAE